MRLANLAISIGCLSLSSCVSTGVQSSGADKEFLERYPTIRENGKAYKVIPHEDILMRREVPAPPAPYSSGTSLCIDLSNRRAWLYEEGQLSLTSPICAGRAGYETPEGEFRVISKHRDWVSTIYKVPMPFFIRLNADDGKVGLHAGEIGLQHLSHGCIRLPKKMAEAFFGRVPVGAKVVVVSGASESHPATTEES